LLSEKTFLNIPKFLITHSHFSVPFYLLQKPHRTFHQTELQPFPHTFFTPTHRALFPWKNKTRKQKEIERKAKLIQHILRKGNYFFLSHVPPIASSQAQNVIHVERVDNSNAFGSPHLCRLPQWLRFPLSVFRFRPSHLYASQAFGKLYVKN